MNIDKIKNELSGGERKRKKRDSFRLAFHLEYCVSAQMQAAKKSQKGNESV